MSEIEVLFQKHDTVVERVGRLEIQHAVTSDRLDHISRSQDFISGKIDEWRGETNAKLDSVVNVTQQQQGAIVLFKWLLATTLGVMGVAVAIAALVIK